MKTTNFEHAKNKNHNGTKNKIRDFFRKFRIQIGDYSYSVFVLPLALLLILCDKIQKWNYNRQQWSEEKATKVLDYFLPHILDYDEDEDCYWYSTAWRYDNHSIAKRVPLGLKVWARKFGSEVKEFIPTQYEKNGYTKTVEQDPWDNYEQWVKFTKN